jgi:HJR/Mrr/RecB family endonuclease
MNRRRNENRVTAIVQTLAAIVGFLYLISFIKPELKPVFALVAAAVPWLLGLFLLIGAAVVVRKLARSQTQNLRQINVQDLVPPSGDPIPYPYLNPKATGNPKQANAVATPPAPRLTDQLRAVDWFQFEKLVAHAYENLGYTVTRRGGANPDGGIDLVLARDGVQTAVQCKQWKAWNVGVKAIREFLGALTDSGIPRGIFVTVGGYTAEAKAFAGKHRIEIVGEAELADLMDRAGARYDPTFQHLLNDTRKYCPKCEQEMVLRTATRGESAGTSFWGCSAYPRCQFKFRPPS